MLIKVQDNLNMEFAIFIVEIPEFPLDREEETKSLWREFLQRLKTQADSTEEIEILGENVLLIHLGNKLALLLKVAELCSGASRPYKVLFFDENPNWITP